MEDVHMDSLFLKAHLVGERNMIEFRSYGCEDITEEEVQEMIDFLIDLKKRMNNRKEAITN